MLKFDCLPFPFKSGVYFAIKLKYSSVLSKIVVVFHFQKKYKRFISSSTYVKNRLSFNYPKINVLLNFP